MNASPVFPRILSAVSRRVHHPPGPRGSRGSLIPTWLYKGAIHRHGNVSGGEDEQRERERGEEDSNTFSTDYDPYPAGKPRLA